jgi:hypothetical protein
MKRIGLVGESPNDTLSIKNLLSRNYKQYQFIQLGRNIRGNQLDSPPFFRIILTEGEYNKVDTVIAIRDLDSLESNEPQLKAKNEWARKVRAKFIKLNNFFLLNITELESLILADIETFNNIYKTKIKYTKNPEFKSEPKKVLRDKTRGNAREYNENDAPDIFKKIDLNKIKKCKSFKKFLTEFESK